MRRLARHLPLALGLVALAGTIAYANPQICPSWVVSPSNTSLEWVDCTGNVTVDGGLERFPLPDGGAVTIGPMGVQLPDGTLLTSATAITGAVYLQPDGGVAPAQFGPIPPTDGGAYTQIYGSYIYTGGIYLGPTYTGGTIGYTLGNGRAVQTSILDVATSPQLDQATFGVGEGIWDHKEGLGSGTMEIINARMDPTVSFLISDLAGGNATGGAAYVVRGIGPSFLSGCHGGANCTLVIVGGYASALPDAGLVGPFVGMDAEPGWTTVRQTLEVTSMPDAGPSIEITYPDGGIGTQALPNGVIENAIGGAVAAVVFAPNSVERAGFSLTLPDAGYSDFEGFADQGTQFSGWAVQMFPASYAATFECMLGYVDQSSNPVDCFMPGGGVMVGNSALEVAGEQDGGGAIVEYLDAGPAPLSAGAFEIPLQDGGTALLVVGDGRLRVEQLIVATSPGRPYAQPDAGNPMLGINPQGLTQTQDTGNPLGFASGRKPGTIAVDAGDSAFVFTGKISDGPWQTSDKVVCLLGNTGLNGCLSDYNLGDGEFIVNDGKNPHATVAVDQLTPALGAPDGGSFLSTSYVVTFGVYSPGTSTATQFQPQTFTAPVAGHISAYDCWVGQGTSTYGDGGWIQMSVGDATTSSLFSITARCSGGDSNDEFASTNPSLADGGVVSYSAGDQVFGRWGGLAEGQCSTWPGTTCSITFTSP